MTLAASGGLSVGLTTDAGAGNINISGIYKSNGVELITSDGTSNYLKTGAALYFQSGSTTRAVLDSSGNLGLGVTPSAWDATIFRTAQIGTGAGSVSLSGRSDGGKDLVLGSNLYYASSSFKYVANGTATMYRMDGATHAWYYAGNNTSGTGANISFTQAMTLDASGKFMVGTTSAIGSSTGSFIAANDVSAVYAGTGSQGIFVSANTTSRYVTYNSSGSLAGGHIWQNGNTEVARLDLSGNLLVGTTSNTNGSRIFVIPSANTSPAFACQGVTGDVANPAAIFGKFDNNTTTSQILVRFTVNNNGAGSGQINANGANTAAFGSYSDERLKENIVDLDPQLSNIMALRPVEFDYIQSEGGGHQTGFIAQNMESVYPDVVGEREDGMKTVTGWSKTEARLVKAIQEQQAIIESLKARLDAANL